MVSKKNYKYKSNSRKNIKKQVRKPNQFVKKKTQKIKRIKKIKGTKKIKKKKAGTKKDFSIRTSTIDPSSIISSNSSSSNSSNLFYTVNNNTYTNTSSNTSTNTSTKENSNKSLLSLGQYPSADPETLSVNQYRVLNTAKARLNFNELRDKIKESTNIEDTMFRYGKPTQLINDFLYSLYNENIIYNENSGNLFNMMASVIELNNKKNIIYITISEEPYTPTDEDFFDKLGKLLHIIEIMLFENKYVENRIGMKNEYKNDNYSYAGGRINLLDIEEDDIGRITSCKSYNQGYRNFAEKNTYDKTFIKPKERGKNTKITAKMYNEYRKILPEDLVVNFVFNSTYINERRNFGKSWSYRPFLKEDKKLKPLVACNSGSICSESKIFSYLHKHGLHSNIIGAIAYWIGKGNNFGTSCYPKGKMNVGICNYHPNYSYEETDEVDKTINIVDLLEKEEKISSELLKRKSAPNYLNVFRAFALPCPGCYLNIKNYNNNRKSLWDNKQCLEFNIGGIGDRNKLKNAANQHPGTQ